MAQEKKRYSFREKMIGVNFVTTLSALILCGSIFILSVWAIVGEYINHDINFFMTTMADTLDSRLEFCEETIYRLRDHEELMEYFRISSEGMTQEQEEGLLEAFEKAVDISSQSSLGAGTLPLIEEVYAFCGGRPVADTSYYAMIYSEEEESNRQFRAVFQIWQEERKEEADKSYGYYQGEANRIYLVFPLCDENMEEASTIIFKIRQDALQTILEDLEGYQNSFWALCDRGGRFIAGNRADDFLQDKEEVLNQWKYSPYTREIGNRSYRVYRKQLCMNAQMIMGIPENHTMHLMFDSVKIYAVFIILIMAGAGILFFWMIYRMTKPIKEITDKLQAVKEGEFETKLPEYNSREFYEISHIFNDMTSYVNHLIKQVYEKQISIKEMELKFLQTQMNPHFMFNVLNTIALQAKLDENEEVYKMISSFSRLTQAKIYKSDKEKVKISQELEYVEYYLYLQSYRFGERLNYHIDIEDPGLTQLYIPKLCIQLIVENAVVHGIEPKMENGLVRVKIYAKEETLFIETTDNGVGFQTEGRIVLPIEKQGDDDGHNHVGLNNVHHMIQLTYGEAYGIEIQSERGKGSRVIIRIPFDYGEKGEKDVSSNACG